ncbi:MAG: peptidylprolyl isomerase [Microbacteriaceae bacterium]
MATNAKADRAAREAKDRLRGYRARQQLNAHQQSRRVRDNWIAGIAAVLVLAGAVGAQLLYFTAGPGSPTPVDTAMPTEPAGANQGDVPDPAVAEDRVWTGQLSLNDTVLDISLDGTAAPQAVASFVSLARSGFFDNVSCHRLTTLDAMRVLQCGDPSGDGSGGPGYSFGPIENAPADGVYVAGTIAMARQSQQAFSMGSQFFIVYEDSTIPADSAGGYTVLGSVTAGLDTLRTTITDAGVLDGSQDGAPKVTTRITAVTVQ